MSAERENYQKLISFEKENSRKLEEHYNESM